MINKVGEKIYYNDDLMYIIYQYDSTYIDKHKLLIKNSLLSICEVSHSFWYDKYEKALREDKNIKYVLELQEAFFDTLELLGIIY